MYRVQGLQSPKKTRRGSQIALSPQQEGQLNTFLGFDAHHQAKVFIEGSSPIHQGGSFVSNMIPFQAFQIIQQAEMKISLKM